MLWLSHVRGSLTQGHSIRKRRPIYLASSAAKWSGNDAL